MSTTQGRIARAAGLIALLTLASRILGFIRESLAVRLFNRLETDAYFASFAVPDFMYYLLVGGALSAAFIPVFTEYLARGEEKEGWRAASTFMNTVTVLLIVIAATGMILSPSVARLEAPGFRAPDTVDVSTARPTLVPLAALGFAVSESAMAAQIQQRQVELNGQTVSDPARLLRQGDTLSLHNRGSIQVIKISRTAQQTYSFKLRRINVSLSMVAILTRIMFSSVAMLAVAGLLSGVLYSYQSFLTPALGPVVYNVLIIGGAAALGSRIGIKGMAYGVVAGAFASLALQFWSVARRHPHYSPYCFNFKHPGFIRMLWLLLPAFFGLSATQLNIAITNMMASGLPEGSITALRCANRLIQLPLGIFAAAVGTAFFPAMARAVAEKKMSTYKSTFSLGIRTILFITIPSAVGLVVLRYPIIRLLFQGQSFSAHDTNMTAYALLFYSLGLFGHACILMLPRAFYSLQDTRTPVIVTATTVAISIGLNLLFLRYTNLRHGGLALSFSIMGLLNMGALLYMLRRKVGLIGGRAIVRTFSQSLLASAAMGVCIWAAARLVPGLPFIAGQRPLILTAAQVGVGMAAGVPLYGLIAYLQKMEEMKLLLGMVKSRLDKRQRTEAPA